MTMATGVTKNEHARGDIYILIHNATTNVTNHYFCGLVHSDILVLLRTDRPQSGIGECAKL
jgi:hypothetical protein